MQAQHRQTLRTDFQKQALLAGVFFLQAQAIALWFVPFSGVLKNHGFSALTPWAFAASGLAAFISPMVTGTLADRHISATLLLRYLALGMSAMLCLTFWAIERSWHAGAVLALIQLLQFVSAPTWGVTSMLVMAQLPNPSRQFGGLRVWGTYGWMFAGPLISLLLHADGSTTTGFISALAWLGVAAFTFVLPKLPPQAGRAPVQFRNLLGLETFSLLKDPQHRALFLTAGLFSIPLAAFYPYTPLHLQDLGLHNVSAFMSLGQLTEVLAMYALAPLLARLRLRTLFLCAIGLGICRYALFAMDAELPVLAGVVLHGLAFTLFFIPAQIYIEHRIPKEMRFRAQALMTLLVSGFGNLFGYLGCGALKAWCTSGTQTQWPLYWAVLGGALVAVAVYFMAAYRGGPAGAGELLPPVEKGQ